MRAGLPRLAPLLVRLDWGKPDQLGSRTELTTWMTPFDCSTSVMVTEDTPPLASVIVSLPAEGEVTVISPPATVLNFAWPPPSLTAFIRFVAVRRPGTT